MANFELKDNGLYWIDGKRKGLRVGRVKRDKYGKPYRQFKNNGIHIYEHRAIWELLNGPIPDRLVIDHIDGNSINNSPSNLRCISQTENNRSKMRRGKGSASGYTGVTWDKRNGAWKAHVEIDGKHKHLGNYRCATSAWVARAKVNASLGFSSIHGAFQEYAARED